MVPSVATARRFQDLLTPTFAGGPYLFDKIFSDQGFWARRLSGKKFKLLKRIDDEIRRMLAEGEQVHAITWGSRPRSRNT